MSEVVYLVKMSSELVAVADQDLRRQLLARLAEEVLLARRADEVVVVWR